MRNERRTKRLERLAASDVVVMMMAIDDVYHWLIRDLLDLIDIGGNGLRTSESDWIGRDYSITRDDEHRLMSGVTVDVNVFGMIQDGKLRGLPWARLLRCG